MHLITVQNNANNFGDLVKINIVAANRLLPPTFEVRGRYLCLSTGVGHPPVSGPWYLVPGPLLEGGGYPIQACSLWKGEEVTPLRPVARGRGIQGVV